MNQIVNEKLETILEAIDKSLANEERALLILEILKELSEIEAEGFGRIVIDVQNKHIFNWWKITSGTARQFRKKIKNISDGGLLGKV